MSMSEDARRHRDLVRDTMFIGITGSCGKTTTKDLTVALLGPDLRGVSSSDDGNCGSKLVKNVLRVQAGDDFCIQELGAWGLGTLDAGLELIQPDVGVVLNIRNDHFSSFRGVSNTQAEKSKVVRVLPPSGTAILNSDDPLVWEMRTWTPARVVSFGQNPESDLCARRIHSGWPERLSFELSYQGSLHRVQTRLLGEHAVGSALAALAVAIVMGIPLRTAIERLAEAPPTSRRMSPVSLEAGITFIRDDFKATNDSISEVARFMKTARAGRKVVVLGRISDHPGRSRRAYSAAVRELASSADVVVLVGERHEDLWGRGRRTSPDFLSELRDFGADVRLFETVRDASRYLIGELRSGDLVLLKACGVSDHLERVMLQFETDVQCWESRCGLTIACDCCARLRCATDPSCA
jgi:UDP-N-acetylmuramoyl-tripeptide--D-alanyl-D-alanine ligase